MRFADDDGSATQVFCRRRLIYPLPLPRKAVTLWACGGDDDRDDEKGSDQGHTRRQLNYAERVVKLNHAERVVVLSYPLAAAIYTFVRDPTINQELAQKYVTIAIY